MVVLILSYILSVNFLQLIEDYGVIITILILAILVSLMLIRNSSKRIKEQEDKIDSLYNRIDKLMNKFSSNEKNDLAGKFKNFAENANKIQIQLYHLLQNYKSERVSIFEFHNGGKNLAGIDFKKCSNTYEAVALETKPEIKNLQNLPLSMNPLWNKILATHDDIDIPSVETLNDSFLKEYLKDLNIKSYYSVILLDYDNTPIGFLTLEYYKEAVELTKDELETINDIAIKISVLINIK